MGDTDPYLKPFEKDIKRRCSKLDELCSKIQLSEGIDNFTTGYNEYGVHMMEDGSICCKEWIPDVKAVFLRGTFNNWPKLGVPFTMLEHGKWELKINALNDGSCPIQHKSELQLQVLSEDGQLLERISPWASYVVQENNDPRFKWKFWN